MKQAIASPLSNLMFANPFNPHHGSIDATSTPKINCVIGIVLLTNRNSYHGTFRLLNNQDGFDLDCGTHHIPFTLFSLHKVPKADFLRILKKQMVLTLAPVKSWSSVTLSKSSMLVGGTTTRVAYSWMWQLLSQFQLEFTGQGKGISRTPDDLFWMYMEFLSLQPIAADQWVSIYLHYSFRFFLWTSRTVLTSICINLQMLQTLSPVPANSGICPF